MNCDQAELKMADFATDRLAPGETATIAAHIGDCASCRVFRDQVAQIYRMKLEDPVVLPTPHLRAPAPRVPRLLRAAAAIIGILIVGGFAWNALRDDDGGAPAEPEPALVATLTPMSLSVPEMPSDYGEGRWTTSWEEATLISRFTGRPIVIEYEFPYCPRCVSMKRSFRTADGLQMLGDFVLYPMSRPSTPQAALRSSTSKQRASTAGTHPPAAWRATSDPGISAVSPPWLRSSSTSSSPTWASSERKTLSNWP